VANILGNYTVGKSWYSERGSVTRETWLCSGGTVNKSCRRSFEKPTEECETLVSDSHACSHYGFLNN
jgi:hypothetical protein